MTGTVYYNYNIPKSNIYKLGLGRLIDFSIDIENSSDYRL